MWVLNKRSIRWMAWVLYDLIVCSEVYGCYLKVVVVAVAVYFDLDKNLQIIMQNTFQVT